MYLMKFFWGLSWPIIELRGQRSEGTSTIFIVESLHEGRSHGAGTENRITLVIVHFSDCECFELLLSIRLLSRSIFTLLINTNVCAVFLTWTQTIHLCCYITLFLTSSFDSFIGASYLLAIATFAVMSATWLYFPSSVWKQIFELNSRDYTIIYFFFSSLFWQGNPVWH